MWFVLSRGPAYSCEAVHVWGGLLPTRSPSVVRIAMPSYSKAGFYVRTNVLQRSVGALDPCRAPPHGNLDASALLPGVPPCLPITLQRPDVSSCALTQAQSAFSLAINMRNQGAELGAPSVDENRSVFVTCAGNGARRGGEGGSGLGACGSIAEPRIGSPGCSFGTL